MANNRFPSISLPQLTFTRFVAACMVVIFHYGRDVQPFSHLQQVGRWGGLGVSYFFFLSGFILAIAYWARVDDFDTREFFRARFARIYPLYLAALLFYIAGGTFPLSLKAFGLSTTLLQAWVPGYAQSLNTPGWSLSVECFFYLIFPFIFPLMVRGKVGVCWAVSTGLWVATLIVTFVPTMPNAPITIHHDILGYFPLIHLATFVMGCMFGITYARYRHISLKAHWPMIGSSIGLVLIFVGASTDHRIWLVISTPAFALFITSLAFLSGPVKTLLSARPLQFLGAISYGIYILQSPLRQLMWKTVFNDFAGPYSLQFSLYFLALLGLSSITYLFLERPARRWLKTLGRKGTPSPRLRRDTQTD